ncbi:MAG: DUF4340 domain-containing protein [Phycisphaeraceae bacterium]|nr:MAG: DUF4340 domain-containing protein [Phycisphaeraceae bacterium]
MNAKPIALLVPAAVAVGLAAYFVSRGGPPPVTPPAAAPMLIPDAVSVIPGVAEIEIKAADRSLTIRRKDGDGPWTLPVYSGYPAKPSRVTDLLAALAGMALIEEKTAKPDWYGRIGVDEPTAPGSTGVLITLKDRAGKSLAAVILGNTAQPGAPIPGVRSARYVRRPGEAQSYLGSGAVEADTAPTSWITNPVLQVPRNSLKTVVLTRAEAPGETPDRANVLDLVRHAPTDANFTVRNLPPGRAVQSPYVVDQAGGALAYVTAEDVRPADQIDFESGEEAPPPAAGSKQAAFVRSQGRFVSFDGLVITTRVTRHDGRYWLTAEAAFDPGEAQPEAQVADPTRPTPEDVRKQADELNARLKGWAFAIGEWNARQLAAKLADLLKDPEPEIVDTPGPIGPPADDPLDPLKPPPADDPG